MKPTFALLTATLLTVSNVSAAEPPKPRTAPERLDIGSRRELFVDDALVERLVGKADFRLHHPTPREVVLVHDAPWEGNNTTYHCVFQDGDRYRMFYVSERSSAPILTRRVSWRGC